MAESLTEAVTAPITLLAELEALRQSCITQDWAAAANLMQAHNAHVRSIYRNLSPAELSAVLLAQHALLEEMMQWRDNATQHLGDIQRASIAASAYRNGASES